MLKDNAPWYERPLLIWGKQKTGTTLLMDLLDGHSRLLVYPNELKIKVFLKRRYRTREQLVADYKLKNVDPLKTHAGYKGSHWALQSTPLPLQEVPSSLRELNALRGQISNLSEDETAEIINFQKYYDALDSGLAEALWSVKDLLTSEIRALADGVGIDGAELTAWGLKEVGGDIELIDRFLSLFLHGKVICIIRDPRGGYASRLRDWKRRQVDHSLKDRLNYLTDYQTMYRDMATVLAAYGPERAYMIRYEDLVRDTEDQMRKLAEFCGLPYERLLERPTKLGRFHHVITASRIDGGEVFANSAERWRTDLSNRAITFVEAAVPIAFKAPYYYEPTNVVILSRILHIVQIAFWYLYRIAKRWLP